MCPLSRRDAMWSHNFLVCSCFGGWHKLLWFLFLGHFGFSCDCCTSYYWAGLGLPALSLRLTAECLLKAALVVPRVSMPE